MVRAKIIFDKEGNTLDIWFGNPKSEAISEETPGEVILKKDKAGKVIGIEILNFMKVNKVPRVLPFHLAVQ